MFWRKILQFSAIGGWPILDIPLKRVTLYSRVLLYIPSYVFMVDPKLIAIIQKFLTGDSLFPKVSSANCLSPHLGHLSSASQLVAF